MCSIAGIVHLGDADTLRKMSAVMEHRGPDAKSQVWFPEWNIGLAHNRLAILDLTNAGAQPMSSPDGRHWLVFNGEIYNYRELRPRLEQSGWVFRSHSDTEILLASLALYGESAVRELNGMFAFAWLDRQSGRLVAARDHLGVKPFYYTQSGNRFAFASEIKALMQNPRVSVERDDYAVQNPARFLLPPQTGFQNICKLPPAHLLIYENGKITLQRYWQIQATETLKDEREALEQIGSLVEKSVERQMIADRPVGAFLSGGLDSSLICALMRQRTQAKMDAFTIRFSSADQKFEQTSEDILYARKVAKQFGFQLHEFEVNPNISELLPLMVWHLDEPLSDPAAINTYLISKAARDMGIIVLLNGVGGDEIFGGYRKHLACLHAETYRKWVPSWARRRIQHAANLLPVANSKRGFVQTRMAKRFLSCSSLPTKERYLSSDLSLTPQRFDLLYQNADYYQSSFWLRQKEQLDDSQTSYLTRMCLNDTRVFLPEHNLLYSDKASMAASIETRPPLADKDIVTAMFNTSPDLRIRGSIQKYLLKKIGERYLPKEVVHRPKASFNSPLRSWIRGPLKPLVDDLLSESQIKKRKLYDPTVVRNMIQEDRAGRNDHSMWLWTLLTVEIWHRTFLDRPPTGPITL